jgi:hypothetical protein
MAYDAVAEIQQVASFLLFLKIKIDQRAIISSNYP